MHRMLVAGALATTGIAVSISACEGTQLIVPQITHRHDVVYERSKNYPGLGVSARIVKGPGVAVGILPDGRRVGLADLKRADALAARQRYNAVVPGFHRTLRDAAPDERFVATVMFRPALDWRNLPPRLFAKDVAEVAAARRELEASIAVSTAELAESLGSSGAEILGATDRMPLLRIRSSAAHLLAMGSDRRISRIFDGRPLEPETRCNGGPSKLWSQPYPPGTEIGCQVDPNVFNGIDTFYNSNDIFGGYEDGSFIQSRVAIYEDIGNCKLYETHEAFDYVQDFHYQLSTLNCYNEHATQVASVISGSAGVTRCGASDVEFYYPNSGSSDGPFGEPSSVCNWSTNTSYSWLSSVGDIEDPEDPPISVVNESYGCLDPNITCSYEDVQTMEGTVQDYYARFYDMVITKAAGDDQCGTAQEACPTTLNSICVGAATSALEVACYSSDGNPGTESGLAAEQPGHDSEWWDREEPDVVSIGGSVPSACGGEVDLVCVAWFGFEEYYEGRYGTSLATAAVTTTIALFREMCEPILGYHIDERFMRALVRNNAGINVDRTAYSTPRPTEDFSDGAGYVSTIGCPDDVTAGGESILVDLNGGEQDPMPSGDADYDGSWSPPGETQSFTLPQDFGYDPDGGDRKWMVLDEWELDEGYRVRASWTSDGCALAEIMGAELPAPPAVDFDLFLFNTTSQTYVWASQSLDDNNEGIDYTIQSGEAGAYQLILAWPEGSESCEASDGGFEPGAYAWNLVL
jgi:hypothetical protein